MKKILLYLGALLMFMTSAAVVHAQDEFIIDNDVIYQVTKEGKTQVTHNVTLTNAFSSFYAKSYTLYLEGVEPKDIQINQGSQKLDYEVVSADNSLQIDIKFSDALVGKGKSRQFTITYTDTSLVEKTGEVWEVTIPRLTDSDSFDNYKVTLLVPASFGNAAYMNPKATRTGNQNGFNSFVFNKDAVMHTGVSAAFGDFQVFSFDLIYHLENPLNKKTSTQIAIPPDSAFQKVLYSSFEPKPADVTIDEDGNYLAIIDLAPRERVDVKVSGAVQIFAENRDFPSPNANTLQNNLAATQYWQVNDPRIKSLAESLGNPKAIYDYLVTNFQYDYDRVRPNVDRLGAEAALSSPDMAICMEFTDTFIALARAAGIPAREVNGYAYTENPEVQPLSLVADVLHSWPEYWDYSKNAWIPIDPTWGNTTGGADYFSSFDLRHFAFVFHGQDDQKPYAAGSYKLGPNPQKDVFVNFGELPLERNTVPSIEVINHNSLFIPNLQLLVTIKNDGPATIYNLGAEVYFDQSMEEIHNFEAVPPYSQRQFEVRVPFSMLGSNTPEEVSIVAGGEKKVFKTPKMNILIVSLIAIFGLSIMITLPLYLRAKHKRHVKVQEKS